MTDRAFSENLGICPECHKLQNMTENKVDCIRCNHHFYIRKPNSLKKTLAWTIAALVMFFPANLYPMMVVYSLGNPDASTIMEGIIIFLQMGMLPVAIIIFIASFVVPLGKIIVLFILVYNASRKTSLSLKQQSKLYHLVEFLGPWSMLDVFVVAVMAAVVDLGFLATIEADMGIIYFTLMVIFTMFAASSFDPRILWDNHSREHNNDK